MRLETDLTKYKAHRYDRDFGTLLDLMDRAETGHAQMADSKKDIEPFGMHIVTWDLSRFTLYLPDYDFFHYEDQGDLFLSLLTPAYYEGFTHLGGSMNDYGRMRQSVEREWEHKNKIEYIAFHVIPRKGVHRAGQILEKVK